MFRAIVFQVTGIEGTYRSTCESVMSVLRGNKDSLMAVLEAFVYDPLLNWRLVFPTSLSLKTVFYLVICFVFNRS